MIIQIPINKIRKPILYYIPSKRDHQLILPCLNEAFFESLFSQMEFFNS